MFFQGLARNGGSDWMFTDRSEQVIKFYGRKIFVAGLDAQKYGGCVHGAGRVEGTCTWVAWMSQLRHRLLALSRTSQIAAICWCPLSEALAVRTV